MDQITSAFILMADSMLRAPDIHPRVAANANTLREAAAANEAQGLPPLSADDCEAGLLLLIDRVPKDEPADAARHKTLSEYHQALRVVPWEKKGDVALCEPEAKAARCARAWRAVARAAEQKPDDRSQAIAKRWAAEAQLLANAWA